MPHADPDERRRWDRMRKRRERQGRAGGRADGSHPVGLVVVLDGPAGPVRLRSSTEILEILEDEVGRFRKSDEMSPGDRLRTIGYALGVAARLLEVGPLEERLAALEEAIEERRRTG